jgi:hypothetical protein
MQRAWNYNCSAVTLTINVTASANFTATGNLVFRTVLVERVINFSVQPGTNGEKDFYDAARKSYPSIQAGTPLPNAWINGQSTTFTLNCVLPNYIQKKSEVAFVGFIQDEGDKTVKQACRADKVALPPDGLAAIAANVEVTCTNQITPKLTVQNTGTSPITSIDITPYVDGVAGSPITWTGNIPVSTTSMITLSSITAPTAAGAHTFSYNITSMSGPLFNITGNSSMVSFMVVQGAQGTPVVEGFLTGTFPPAGWVNVNPNQGTGWVRTTAAGGYFQTPANSAKYDFFNNTAIGDQDELILPPMDLSGSTDVEMSFDWAYAQRNSASNDKLEVFVSSDCGANWNSVWMSQGATLATTMTANAYTPTDINEFTQWQTAVIALPGYNKSSVLAKFVVTNDNGNNLYLDNINLAQKNPTGISKIETAGVNANVFPNPAVNAANVVINSNVSGTAKINVTNTMGQVIISKTLSVQNGANTVAIDLKDVAAGVYNVVIATNEGSVTKKLTVSK